MKIKRSRLSWAFGAAMAGTMLAAPSYAAMTMDMTTPAHFPPTKQVYSADHSFLIKLLSVPKPIPYEKYFTLKFGVYDGHHPGKLLPDAGIRIFTGMRHGLKHGFAHGMESSPKITNHGGVFTIRGMYFTMMGPWVMKMSVHDGAKHDIVYFKFPCCGA